MRLGDRQWRARRDRERDRFDRTFAIMFPIAVALGVLGALATIALYAGAAAWVWGQVP